MDNGALIAAAFFAVLLAIYGLQQPGALTLSSVTDLLNNALPVALAAAGATLVVLTRGFDLSVAGVVSLANVLIATGPTEGPWAPVAALAMVLAVGMAVGTVILAIAFIDELVLELRGRRVVPQSDEATRNE